VKGGGTIAAEELIVGVGVGLTDGDELGNGVGVGVLVGVGVGDGLIPQGSSVQTDKVVAETKYPKPKG
jgi:hypothetical protein